MSITTDFSTGIGWRISQSAFQHLSVDPSRSKWENYRLPNGTKPIDGIYELYEEIGRQIKPFNWFCSNYYDEPSDFCLVLPLEANNMFGDQIIPENIKDLRQDAMTKFNEITGIDLSEYKFAVIHGIWEA